ncbi:MAG: DUF732 domain-containing protein [Mycobacterium sp.]|uniref:DUF732 domain-containing protein n=1 Tax=Mycobacterium sp. TaxID=1785 RepID=UPI003BB0DC8D
MLRNMIAGLALAAGLAAGASFVPATAHADISEYLAFLRSHGVPFTSNDAAVQQGIQICTEGVGIGQLETKMGRAEAEDYVMAAHQYLC